MDLQALSEFMNKGGDNKFRFNYPLSKKSIVFDAGGFEGTWAEKIYQIYGCTVYIFEPINEYYVKLKDKFKGNDNIYVFNLGLSNETKKCQISVNGNASSIYGTGNLETIQLVSFGEFLVENNIKHIDLLKINIEGGEYDLFEDIIENNLLPQINALQIQFHDFVDNCVSLRNDIRENLSKYHREEYNFNFVWESWIKK